jgi:hypothetical protein
MVNHFSSFMIFVNSDIASVQRLVLCSRSSIPAQFSCQKYLPKLPCLSIPAQHKHHFTYLWQECSSAIMSHDQNTTLKTCSDAATTSQKSFASHMQTRNKTPPTLLHTVERRLQQSAHEMLFHPVLTMPCIRYGIITSEVLHGKPWYFSSEGCQISSRFYHCFP